MIRVYARGEEVRRFILEQVEAHPKDIAKVAADHFRITRQAVNRHMKTLVAESVLEDSGNTRSRIYKLRVALEWHASYPITGKLAEDVIWRNDIRNVLGQQPPNVFHIWEHGFTEMFNNAIDHSEGDSIFVCVRKTAVDTEITIQDDGVGIFRKIQDRLNLLDDRHAVLELSKGKLTTDPERHSGEGIFFTSRMFDQFMILSGGVYFSHRFGKPEDWILESGGSEGTIVRMKLSNHTARTTKQVFDEYAGTDNYGFTKTVVPVELAQYGNDRLVSRSQAKRLLDRVELFKTVIFDFRNVDVIGQAFADEIFRVFAAKHPEIELLCVEANSEVEKMIGRATSGEIAHPQRKESRSQDP